MKIDIGARLSTWWKEIPPAMRTFACIVLACAGVLGYASGSSKGALVAGGDAMKLSDTLSPIVPDATPRRPPGPDSLIVVELPDRVTVRVDLGSPVDSVSTRWLSGAVHPSSPLTDPEPTVTQSRGSETIGIRFAVWRGEDSTYLGTVSIAPRGGPTARAARAPRGAPPPPPPPTPPDARGASRFAGWDPPGAPIYDEDYTRFTSWAQFKAAAPFRNMGQLENAGRNNVNVEVSPLGLGTTGQGMWYRYRAQPRLCGDQIVGQAEIALPANTRELWVELEATFSANWTNENRNCSAPAPDYKFLLAWYNHPDACSGLNRSQMNLGGHHYLSAENAGYPECDAVPVNPGGVAVPGNPSSRRHPPGTIRNPAGAAIVLDGQPHTYRVYFGLSSRDSFRSYIEVDGQVTHDITYGSERGRISPDLLFRYLMLASNRNLGATEDMFVTWRSVKVWTGE